MASNACLMWVIAMESVYGFMFEMDHIQKRFLDFCTYYDSLYDGDYILKSGLSDRIGYIGPLAIVVNEMFLGM